MRYLLDTNILSALTKRPEGPVHQTLYRTARQDVGTSIIVAAELRYGYVKIGSTRWERIIEAILESITVVPWDRPADIAYARLRTASERQGITVAQNDMLIAAHAVAIGAILVSDDRVFPRIDGLRVENWLRPENDEF